MKANGGFACAIPFWELGLKIKPKQLNIGLGIEKFARRTERSGIAYVVALDSAIWLSSLRLRWKHRDPADRVVVATALVKGAPLHSKDAAIRAFRCVDCVW